MVSQHVHRLATVATVATTAKWWTAVENVTQHVHRLATVATVATAAKRWTAVETLRSTSTVWRRWLRDGGYGAST